MGNRVSTLTVEFEGQTGAVVTVHDNSEEAELAMVQYALDWSDEMVDRTKRLELFKLIADGKFEEAKKLFLDDQKMTYSVERHDYSTSNDTSKQATKVYLVKQATDQGSHLAYELKEELNTCTPGNTETNPTAEKQ